MRNRLCPRLPEIPTSPAVELLLTPLITLVYQLGGTTEAGYFPWAEPIARRSGSAGCVSWRLQCFIGFSVEDCKMNPSGRRQRERTAPIE
jgi:hypothetical protein